MVDGNPRLFAHEGEDFAVSAGFNAAGVNERKFPPVPVRFSVDAVAGHARRVLHNGNTFPNQFVEQCGLAHVGPPDNRYNRLCHYCTPFLVGKQGKHSFS